MTVLDTVGRYGAAIAAGDMEALAATLSEDVVWHQPGDNPLSGDHRGPAGVVAHLGTFFELSQGTFRLDADTVIASGDLVVMTVTFSAQRAGKADLQQSGVDVFRVQDDRICEVWLIREDQAAEDAFWS